MVSIKQKFVGKWHSSLGDFLLSKYIISLGENNCLKLKIIDFEGEEMSLDPVIFNGDEIKYTCYCKSTGRKSLCALFFEEDGTLIEEIVFSKQERLKRISIPKTKITSNNEKNFTGTWASENVFDSDNFDTTYYISASFKQDVFIKAVDRDNEKMKVDNVYFHENTLEFNTLMPSTNEEIYCDFRLIEQDTIKSNFTFTYYRRLKKYEYDFPED